MRDFLNLEPPSEFREVFPKLAAQVLVNPPGSGQHALLVLVALRSSSRIPWNVYDVSLEPPSEVQ
jgi:hypothetical protein